LDTIRFGVTAWFLKTLEGRAVRLFGGDPIQRLII